MLDRELYEIREEKGLAPYAQLSSKSLGRKYPEKECVFRSRYYRDVGRIIHSTAFRLLEYKTQVFVTLEGDYYRTRLTHTLEVSQISRGLSRILGVNEDLAEAIALAHDMGHTPFGHNGEKAMNEAMKKDGGFEHNVHSYRIVTNLEERYSEFPGLNLSYEVLEGILKHTTDYDNPHIPDDFKDVGFSTIEAQIVNFADQIAYMNHDLDDGLHWGMLTLNSLKDVTLWDEIFEKVKKEIPDTSSRIHRCRTISYLINEFITDLQAETKKRIAEKNIKSIEDVRKRGKDLVSFSEGMTKKASEVKKFLYENVYYHPQVVEMSSRGARIVSNLFKAYFDDPKLLPEKFYKRYSEEKSKRHIADYIAGMTDRFAIEEHERLVGKID